MAAVATTVMGTSAAIADGNSGGIGITVTVTQAPGSGTPTPTSTPSSTSTSSSAPPPSNSFVGSAGSGTGTTSGTSSGSGTVVTPTLTGKPVPSADEFDLGGLIFISGVTSDYVWSINPLGGESHAQFTVHNVSTETIDGAANFSIIGPFGNEISRVDDVPITALKPDESRVIDTTFTGLSQWAFFTTHATLVPPATVEGVALTPVTRDGFMFVLPWFLLVLLILGIGTYSVVRIIREAEFVDAVQQAAEPTNLAGGVA